MTEFILDERLARRPVAADWALSTVLFVDDSRFPWVILVPRVPNVTEIYELTDGDQATLMSETVRASRAIKAAFSPDKLNVGALGHHVPQLHVHVIGRGRSDPVWPDPVWGPGEREPHAPVPYGDPGFEEALGKLRAALEAA